VEKHGTASIGAIPGWAAEFIAAIIRQLPKEIDEKSVQGWINNQAYLKETLKCLLPEPHFSDTYYVDVRYNLKLQEMINEGAIRKPSSQFASYEFSRFDGAGTDKVNKMVTLLDFDHFLGTNFVIEQIRGTGRRPANIYELLALGTSCPCYSIAAGYKHIIALGSPVNENKYPALCEQNNKKDKRPALELVEEPTSGWGQRDVFASVIP
jgi:hypothetical protein